MVTLGSNFISYFIIYVLFFWLSGIVCIYSVNEYLLKADYFTDTGAAMKKQERFLLLWGLQFY